MPGLFTNPMPVEDAARAIVDGIERRAARVCASRWVDADARRARAGYDGDG
jgi:hypothetical protein